jgi:hypothetical protein
MDEQVLKSILHTFYSVFPNGAVFTSRGDEEMILIGSRKPIQFHLDRLNKLFAEPRMARKLSAIPLRGSSDIVALYTAGRDALVQQSADAIFNTDRNVFAEVKSSRTFYAGAAATVDSQTILNQAFDHSYLALVPPAEQTPDFFYGLLSSLRPESDYEKMQIVLSDYEKVAGNLPSHAGYLGYFCLSSRRYASARAYLEKAMAKKPGPELLTLMISASLESDEPARAIALARRYPRQMSPSSECYLLDASLREGKLNQAKHLASKMEADQAAYGECGDYYNKVMGSYYLASKQLPSAVSFLEAYTKTYPTDAYAVARLNQAYRLSGTAMPVSANGEATDVPSVVKAEADNLFQLASFYRRAGFEGDAAILETRAKSVSELMASE